MKIMIVGAGVVGSHLAEALSGEGLELSLVDADPARIDRLELDVRCVCGDGTSPQVLEEAGIKDTNLLIAVTDNDHRNLIIALLASRYDVDRKVARVRQPELHGEVGEYLSERLGIDLLINPEEEVVSTLVKLIDTPGTSDVADFAGGAVVLRGFIVEPDTTVSNLRLEELRTAIPSPRFLVVAIDRDERLLIPKGNTQLLVDDKIFVVTARDDLPALLPHVGVTPKDEQRIVIGYASRTALRLAQRLEQQKEYRVVLIEPDWDRCTEASVLLHRTEVYHGEPTSLKILREQGVASADHFIALSDHDESNLMAALLARKVGAGEVTLQTHGDENTLILDELGLDFTVNARLLTVAAILRHVRRGRVLAMAKIGRGEAEAIEFEIITDSPLCNRTVAEINLPEGSMLGAVDRGGEIILPDGATILKEGDHALVFTLPEAVEKIESLFSREIGLLRFFR